MDDHEGERREPAIAFTPYPQTNFKPKGVSQEQLSKFQELQMRRLKIKSKSNIRKKTKDVTGNSKGKYLNIRSREDEAEDSKNSNSNIDFREKSVHDNTKPSPPSKKLHKLHWGLDIKEPWERKANM